MKRRSVWLVALAIVAGAGAIASAQGFMRRMRVPQIPSIRLWRPGGSTSEDPPDTDEVHGRGIHDRDGHLIVFMTHNTDIAHAWEREGDAPRYFYEFGPNGYALGINAIPYALSH